MICELSEALERHPLPPTADGREFILNPLQVEDITIGVTYDRCGLFLPVGYGKTVIATMIALMWDHVPIRVVLVPPILIPQWVKWLNSIPNSGGAIGYGVDIPQDEVPDNRFKSPRVRKALPVTAAQWWVMSYGVFRNDLPHLIKLFANVPYTTIVDEAQNLKNPQSVLFKSVDSFSAGRNLLLLTGTELNKPDDAYAYIKLKTPTIYRSKGHFEQMHVVERDFFDKPIRWQGLDIITQNLYLKSRQRTKEEVHAHLPKANYLVDPPWSYSLSPEHKAFYDQLAEEMLVETEAGGKIDGTTPGKLRNALQQLVINWGDFSENPEHRSNFYDLLDYAIEEADIANLKASKFIVWTWFKMTTRNITGYINQRLGIPAVAAYSEVDSHKSVRAFMEQPEVRVLVAQPGSAGAGLNPQYFTWECMFAEFPTRTILFRQSAGRIDREGQRFNPNIRICTARGTVQPGMYADLLANDGLVQRVQGNTYDLRKLVYG